MWNLNQQKIITGFLNKDHAVENGIDNFSSKYSHSNQPTSKWDEKRGK